MSDQPAPTCDTQQESETMLRLKMSWAKVLGTQIICGDCGKECPRTGPSQRYCRECSEARAAVRKSRWVNRNPSDPERQKLYRDRKRSRLLEAGAATNDQQRLTLDSAFGGAPPLAWVCKLGVPFSYAASKNHMSRLSAEGHVYLRTKSRSYRADVATAVRLALAPFPVAHNKLWVSLVVQKPDHRGDAVNVLDLVIDAIKDAVKARNGLDDRWFCIGFVDWQIVKNAPQLLIAIGQEHTWDASVCSHCGRVLDVEAFSKRKDTPLGRSRCCRECQAASRRQR